MRRSVNDDIFRKHLQELDPFAEMKQGNFFGSSKAIDVLLAQLNTDVEQRSDPIENKSTIEQQFYNYMEVRRKRKRIESV